MDLVTVSTPSDISFQSNVMSIVKADQIAWGDIHQQVLVLFFLHHLLLYLVKIASNTWHSMQY